jgi:hypothetical protein
MANNLSATDIVNEFGAYYLNNGQNLARLRKLIYQRTMTPQLATPIMTDESQYRHSTAAITEVAQGFHINFTTKGDSSFTPRTIDLRRIKIDQRYSPDVIVESWLGFLATIDDADRKNWPIVRWLWENLVLPRKDQDMELKAYYQGVYSAAGGVTPTAAKATLDGLRKQAIEAIAAVPGNNLTAAIGNLTTATIFDQVEAFGAKVLEANEALVNSGGKMYLCMSNKWKVAYLKDKRETLGTNVNYDAGKLTVDFIDNLYIVGLPSMVGFDDLIAFPEGNLLHCFNRTKPPVPSVKEVVERQISLYTDWREGLGFAFDEYVFMVNNGASGSGSAS